MANHSYNTTFLYGPEEDLKRLSDRVDTTQGLLNSLYPMPDGMDDIDEMSWAITNWSTKWEIDCWQSPTGPDQIVYVYTTAWGAPAHFWKNVSAQFPTLRFITTFHVPGVAVGGQAHANGEMLTDIYIEVEDENNGDKWLDMVYTRLQVHTQLANKLVEMVKGGAL